MTMLRSKSEMKDSGIDWIGEIPKTWSIGKIKSNYEIVLGKMLQNQPAKTTDTLENYLCATNIKWLGIDTSVSKQMWFSTNEKSQYLLEDGDVVVMEGGTAGTAAIYNGEFAPCYMQNSVNRCRTKGQYLNKYLFYWLYHVFHVGYIASICNKATIMHYTKEKLANTPLLAVPISEQQAIVSYLDDRCSKLDEIITEAEKSIEEYKELKQAVIFEAVTKGLDKKVPMKDSGIDFLGSIPAHWKITQLKRICERITDGSHFSPETVSDGMPYVTAGDVHGKGINYEICRRISNKDFASLVQSGCRPQKGDVLLVKDGATTGRVGLMTDNEECVLLSSVAMLTPINRISSEYLMYLLESNVMQYQIKKSMAGSAMPRTTLTKLMSYMAIDCPLNEQLMIVDYLNSMVLEYDALISEKQSLIEDLKVYKKSLIYEVVTGKRRVV